MHYDSQQTPRKTCRERLTSNPHCCAPESAHSSASLYMGLLVTPHLAFLVNKPAESERTALVKEQGQADLCSAHQRLRRLVRAWLRSLGLRRHSAIAAAAPWACAGAAAPF